MAAGRNAQAKLSCKKVLSINAKLIPHNAISAHLNSKSSIGQFFVSIQQISSKLSFINIQKPEKEKNYSALIAYTKSTKEA